MFFEYDKGQIGQPVKTLTLNRHNNSAIIEFESSRAIDVVLSKRPVTIMDKMLEIDVLSSYLEDGEKLGSVNVKGIPEVLGKELMRLHLDDQNYVQWNVKSDTEKRKVIQILIVGDTDSGKSCLTYRFVQETFSDRTVPTVGINLQNKNVTIAGRQLKLHIFDTSGLER